MCSMRCGPMAAKMAADSAATSSSGTPGPIGQTVPVGMSTGLALFDPAGQVTSTLITTATSSEMTMAMP
jgi:hypothetical protein